MPITHHVPDSDLPQLFQAADRASQDAQRSYLRGTRNRLWLLVGAAATGVATWRIGSGNVDVFGLVGVVAFILTILVELNLWRTRPDKAWYDGRAVAESAKTLAWKYAVCGGPFPAAMPDADATRELVRTLEGVRNQFGELELEALNAPTVSAWMSQQRSSCLEDRRQTYLDARVREQRSWYSRKANYNKKQSTRWRRSLFLLEVLGAVSSLVAALIEIPLLLAPAVAAAIGAVVAWVETKQHDALTRAYSAAVTDLSNAEAKLRLADSENTWAAEVDDAEEAISREHVVWLATRSRVSH